MTENQNQNQTNVSLYAKLAGLSYVVFTLAGFTKMFLNPRLSDLNTLELNGLFQNEMHFRLNIALEVVIFLAVVGATVSFYAITKSISKQLSRTAVCLRLVELIVGGMAVVFGMTMLNIASKPYFLDLLDLEQLRTVLLIVANFVMPAYEYSWISMGFAGIITFYLLYKAQNLPKGLAVWGVVTYTSLIVYPLAKILIPDLPREVMYVMFPGALFELTVGIWLMKNGLKKV